MDVNGIEVEVIHSRRRTMSVSVTAAGEVVVRAPLRMSERRIRSFVEEHRAWIERHLEKSAERAKQVASVDLLGKERIEQLADQARTDLCERVRRIAPLVGVTYGRVTIRMQRTRWGSCSSKGNLNFNCLLMLAPEEVRDYVVTHELCHRKEMNHSPRFWAEVARVLPDYETPKAWLKDNGKLLLARAGL